MANPLFRFKGFNMDSKYFLIFALIWYDNPKFDSRACIQYRKNYRIKLVNFQKLIFLTSGLEINYELYNFINF